VTKLQRERLSRGMSQTALAAAAGKMGASDISRGYGRPYPAQAERLAQVLGLPASELLKTIWNDRLAIVTLWCLAALNTVVGATQSRVSARERQSRNEGSRS